MFEDASNFNQDLSSWCVDAKPYDHIDEPYHYKFSNNAWFTNTDNQLPVWWTCPSGS